MVAENLFNFTETPELCFRVVLTNSCNNDCIYCFKEAEVGSNTGNFTSAFFDELIRVAEKCGINKIHFTGGEPLLDKNIVKYIKQIKNTSNLDIGLTTNGTLLNLYGRDLHEAGLRRINVSVPTLNSLKYQFICKNRDIKQVLENIDELISLGYCPIKINVPIFKQNINEVNDFLIYFLKKKNIVLRFFSLLPNPGVEEKNCLSDDEVTKTLNQKIALLPQKLRQEAIQRVFYRCASHTYRKMCKECSWKSKCQDQAKAIRITKDGKFSLCLYNPR
ncbi:MAG TPA: radical SAM protein, partial [bacterium]|nr:radical SAM protein [bacterium]